MARHVEYAVLKRDSASLNLNNDAHEELPAVARLVRDVQCAWVPKFESLVK